MNEFFIDLVKVAVRQELGQAVGVVIKGWRSAGAKQTRIDSAYKALSQLEGKPLPRMSIQ